MIKIYVKTDNNSNIVAVNGGNFLADLSGWVEIDEGKDYPKYVHSQNNYFEDGIFTEFGIPKFKLVDGKAVAKSKATITKETNAIEKPKTEIEKMEDLITDLQIALCEIYESEA